MENSILKSNSLPLLETLYNSVAWPWYYRKQLSLALLPMFLALVCLEVASIYLPGASEGKQTWVLALVYLFSNILYTITIHRFLILGPESTPRFGVFQWRGREWTFLLYTVGLSILLGVMTAVPLMAFFSSVTGTEQSTGSRIIMFVVCLPAFLLFARLSLVFPAIATDSDFSLAKIWSTGRGNSFRLAVIVYLVPAAGSFFYYLLPDWLHRHFETLITVTWILIGYVLWAIEIACLSFAYKYLIAASGEAVD